MVEPHSDRWPRIAAEQLQLVREPLAWQIAAARPAHLREVCAVLARAAQGAADSRWVPPAWLLPHQIDAARRIAGRLAAFRGALLADAPGLGKTYVALAVATRYRSIAAVVPACLKEQWSRIAATLGLRVHLVSHEALSTGAAVPSADLLVVDEAHRFRNPETRRYDTLARAAVGRHLLLITATFVVNRPRDAAHLLRLFLPDQGLALGGVPSIEESWEKRSYALGQALATVTVARTERASLGSRGVLPRVRDSDILRPPPVPTQWLERFTQAIADLSLPTVRERDAAALMRLHLYARLSSSLAALVETLKRHRRYLAHALERARLGEPLSRRAARWLIDAEDELQLELAGLLAEAGPALPEIPLLEEELAKVQEILDLAKPAGRCDPKARCLARLLQDATRTIVFTSAVSTAVQLARTLRWTRVAVATGRGARIASGPIALSEALALFAPRAQGRSEPRDTLRVHTLIATDLVSEGLNLQDAARVIHYDLPWSPFRLEQRLGRIARLGSLHRRVDAVWFAPHPFLERHLSLERRIAEKALHQIRSGVPLSSEVGKGRVVGGLFDWRERFGRCAATAAPSGLLLAAIAGPRAILCALCWRVGEVEVPQLMVLAGNPLEVVPSEQQAAAVVAQMLDSEERPPLAPRPMLEPLYAAVKARARAAQCSPGDRPSRRLARRIMRRARRAAARRELRLLALLDRTLEQVKQGLPIGALRDLEDLLADKEAENKLRTWLARLGPPRVPCPVPTLEAALLGVP